VRSKRTRPLTCPLASVLLGAVVLAGCAQSPTTEATPTHAASAFPSATPSATPSTPPRQSAVIIAATNDAVSPSQTTIEALNPDNGAVLWQSTAHAGGNISLQVASGDVYALIAGSGTGVLVALDAATGQQLWQVTPQASGAASMDAATGTIFLSSPASTGHSGLVEAYRASDGTRLWQHDAGSCAAGQLAAGSGIVLVTPNGCQQPMVVALRESDGSVAWQQSAPDNIAGGGPAVVDGVAYLNAYGVVCAYDAPTGARNWCYQPSALDSEGDPAPAVSSGIVLAGNGLSFYALQASSGNRSWSLSVPSLVGAETLTPDTAYVTSGFSLIALTASTGRQLWADRLDGPEADQPVVAHGVIYVNDDGGAAAPPPPAYLYAVRASDGAVLWKYMVTSGAISPPVLR
jgi:outer membrane protein assembly factor BamB